MTIFYAFFFKSTVLNNCFYYAACVSLKILCIYINCFESFLKRFIALPRKWSHLKHLSYTEVPTFDISSSKTWILSGVLSLVTFKWYYFNCFFLKDSFFLIGWQRSKFFIAFTASLPIQGVVTYHKVYAQHVPRELALVTVPSSQSKHFTPFDILRTCEATPLVTQEKHPQFLAGLADEEISQ